MKNKLYYFVFAAYFIILVLALQNDPSLQHEWLLMMEQSSFKKGLWMLGKPTAYMPPLYAYYLLACKAIFGFTDWIKISVAIQALIYFFSLRFLLKSLINRGYYDTTTVAVMVVLLFFPPIFLGNIGIGSFSLSISVLCYFFGILYRIYQAERASKLDIAVLILVSIAGLYLRYEFIYIAILSAAIFLWLRKIRLWTFGVVCLLSFVSYLPWMARNYIAIGTFSYATSLNYNFAKGYNEKYDIFSSYNFPYAPETDEKLGVKKLYKKFQNEKEVDEYLSALNKNFIDEHPEMFYKLTLQKLGINLLQYFPDYHGISRHGIYIYYSVFFVLFQIALLRTIRGLYESRQRYLFAFTLSLYLFFVFFYSIAPLPRYLLLFTPVFAAVIIKNLEYRKL